MASSKTGVRSVGLVLLALTALACGGGDSADNSGGGGSDGEGGSSSGSGGKSGSSGKGGSSGKAGSAGSGTSGQNAGGSGGAGPGGSSAGGSGGTSGSGGSGAGGSGGSGAGGSGGSGGSSAGGTGPVGPEVCDDGLDNDGNGQVDEGCACTPGATEACYLGKPSELGAGTSCKSGTHTCNPKGEFGEWGPCTGSVLPASAEVCNGVDDDCSGKADEGCECIPGEKSACGPDIPPCKPGEKVCTAQGKWGPCEGGVPPKEETCNAKDDNCDGLVDNTTLCECVPGSIEKCGPNLGTCTTQGVKICDTAGQWGDCMGGTQPDPEACDGVDNDCDGEVDEEGLDGKPCECVPGTQAACGKKDGECKPGTQVCQAGGVWSDCVGAVLPKPETCNGKDDDCDGVIDKPECECLDGTKTPCEGNKVGACDPGATECVNGKLSACQGAVGPTSEVCGDNVDNDCDGTVDNGCKKDIAVDININGDCVCSAPCPPEAPYPVGCNVNFIGGDPRGCVATAGARIYFQEGDACGAGKLEGKLFCSSEKGSGLNSQNCPINKPQPTYGKKPSDCADIGSGKPGSCYF